MAGIRKNTNILIKIDISNLFFSDINDFEFTSESSVAELKFDVINMNSVDDFRSFGFEASVEFVRLDAVCENNHRVHGASGHLHLFARLPITDTVSIIFLFKLIEIHLFLFNLIQRYFFQIHV